MIKKDKRTPKVSLFWKKGNKKKWASGAKLTSKFHAEDGPPCEASSKREMAFVAAPPEEAAD